MSEAGILRRGKANYEAGKFLDNPETLYYLENKEKASQEAPKANLEVKPKEAKTNAKPTK